MIYKEPFWTFMVVIGSGKVLKKEKNNVNVFLMLKFFKEN